MGSVQLTENEYSPLKELCDCAKVFDNRLISIAVLMIEVQPEITAQQLGNQHIKTHVNASLQAEYKTKIKQRTFYRETKAGCTSTRSLK